MENSSDRSRSLSARYEEVFSHLNELDIEQFYAHYQLWLLHHRVPILERQIEMLREHVEENQQHMAATRPSAIAMAVLARLQSKGVSDVNLLDQMLERGEDWLDRMMQRLDYCEQVEDFIRGDYTQWCVNSLDGAYDWIDTVRSSPAEETDKRAVVEVPSEAETQATEELLLQKLSTDDEETMRGVTIKLPVIKRGEESSEPDLATAREMLETEAAEAAGENEEAQLAEPESGEADDASLVATGSQEKLESADEEVASWYSQEADEAFSFAEPRPMNDWIKVLQADTESRSEEETTETSFTHTNEIALLETPEPPSEEEEVETAQVSASEETLPAIETEPETATESENDLEVPQSPDENSAESSEAGSGEFAPEATMLVSEPEETVLPSEVLQDEETAEEEATCEQADDIDTLTPAELVDELEALAHEETATCGEPAEDAESAEVEVSPAHQLVEEIEALVHQAEVISETEKAPPPAEATAENSEEVLSPLPEAIAESPAEVLSPLPEAIAESPAQESGEEEARALLSGEPSSSLELEVETLPVTEEAPGERAPAASTGPLQEHEFDEAAVINSILEPEEGELAWYEYLEMERLGLASQNEIKASPELEELQVESSEDAPGQIVTQSEANSPSLQTANLERESPIAPQMELEDWEELSSDTDADKTQPMVFKMHRSVREPENGNLAEQAISLEQPGLAGDTAGIIARNTGTSRQDSQLILSTGQGQEATVETEIKVENEWRAQPASEQETPEKEAEEGIGVVEPVIPLTAEKTNTPPEQESPGKGTGIQAKPQKRSFWQWLFRRKPKGSS